MQIRYIEVLITSHILSEVDRVNLFLSDIKEVDGGHVRRIVTAWLHLN